MGVISIACYKAKEGREASLLEIVKRHVPILRTQGLVTDRKPLAMRAGDGTIVEVFEWRSKDAIDAAHRNTTVKDLWARFGDACDFVKLSQLAEAGELFANFTPIEM
jgi:hypothetical protein